MLIKTLLVLGIAHAIYGQYFNSNPRQQDHSGGLNLQLDTSSTSTQNIGSRSPRSDLVYGSSRRSGFNSNPRQQDHSGGLNLQIDTSSTGLQYIGPRPSGSETAVPLSYSPYGSSRRSGFNSNPRQQDFSGSSNNLQIDTSSNSRQYIGPGQGSRYPSTSSVGRPQYGNGLNLNPRQQDLSGGRNAQIDSSGRSRQYIGPGRGNPYSPASSTGRPQYGTSFNSNPRQQDLSGGRNVQIDTSENSKQYIGPGRGSRYPATSSIGRPQYGNGFNTNPRQQDHSGGRNVQIDISGRSRQYIGHGMVRSARGSSSEVGVAYPNYGDLPRVQVNGMDYTGQNVQRPGLHINQNV